MTQKKHKTKILELASDIRNKLTYPDTIFEYWFKKDIRKEQIEKAHNDLNEAIDLLRQLEKYEKQN